MKYATIIALLGYVDAQYNSQVTDESCDKNHPADTNPNGNALCKKYAAALADTDSLKCGRLVEADGLTINECLTLTMKAVCPEANEGCNPLEGKIRSCKADSDCQNLGDAPDAGFYDNGGCCNFWTWESSNAENPKFGKFANVWTALSTEGPNVKGSNWGACMPKPYVDGAAALAKEGPANNYDDLILLKKVFGKNLNHYETADEWIRAWGSDKAT